MLGSRPSGLIFSASIKEVTESRREGGEGDSWVSIGVKSSKMSKQKHVPWDFGKGPDALRPAGPNLVCPWSPKSP